MKSLEKAVKDLANPILSRIERLEQKQSEQFVLYYKPPKHEDYQKINEVLDNLHLRLNKLEELE